MAEPPAETSEELGLNWTSFRISVGNMGLAADLTSIVHTEAGPLCYRYRVRVMPLNVRVRSRSSDDVSGPTSVVLQDFHKVHFARIGSPLSPRLLLRHLNHTNIWIRSGTLWSLVLRWRRLGVSFLIHWCCESNLVVR